MYYCVIRQYVTRIFEYVHNDFTILVCLRHTMKDSLNGLFHRVNRKFLGISVNSYCKCVTLKKTTILSIIACCSHGIYSYSLYQ